ncbi:MAG: hypothetical protein AAFR59_18030, partial [Bacteroidota bacterium]
RDNDHILMKKLLLLLVLLACALLTKAQDRPFSTALAVGITTPILDNGLGFYTGIHPSYHLSSHFSLEGQVSYLYTSISGSFLSGEQATSHAINTLAGGRLYLNGEASKYRFFLNLLLGGNYTQEQTEGMAGEGAFGLGFSGGGYMQVGKLWLGLSYDTPQNVVLKAGYRFGDWREICPSRDFPLW